MHFRNPRHLLISVRFLFARPKLGLPYQRFFSYSVQSSPYSPSRPRFDWPSIPIPEHIPNPNRNREPDSNLSPNADSNFSLHDFSTIANIFVDPSISPGSALETALDRTGIEPDPALLLYIFDRFNCSPKMLHSLFLWAQKRPGFRPSVTLFNSMINVLAKSREFDSAWILLLDWIDRRDEDAVVTKDTFVIMIRRYSSAGKMPFQNFQNFSGIQL